MRMLRAAPMTVIYMAGLLAILPVVGRFPPPPIRGPFVNYFLMGLMMPTIGIFLFLTFLVIDAILVHEGFLRQLQDGEIYEHRIRERRDLGADAGERILSVGGFCYVALRR
jgi:hypothetical protein